jgi:hypothetical protein
MVVGLIGKAHTEREGFEPPETRISTVFKTASFNRSDISPIRTQTIAMGLSFVK